MQEQEQSSGMNLKPENLDPAYAEEMRAEQSRNGISAKRRKEAKEAWMEKLEKGDYSGPTQDKSRYLTMRNTTIEGNPRQTEEYRRLCREA